VSIDAAGAIHLQRRAAARLTPTAPFHFPATVHKPSHFRAPINVYRSGVYWQTLRLGDDEYVAVARPLAVRTGAEPGPVAVVLRSRTERLRFLNSLHTQLAATAVLAVLAATLLSYGIARTVTRPLGTITATMREMTATGDLTRRVPTAQATAWHDEDARLLAAAFNTMTASIARFQQEAGERERLSSLGRLSTVIAHEIRNPLMIIKATLRTLKGPEAHREAVDAAVRDIEEEVARLNRIVSEVLDFARPIDFRLGPVDVNDLCRSAAAAVAPDGDAGPALIRLDLDPRLPANVTDGERLRLVLVNVLANACQAVEARLAAGGSGPGPGEVRVVTGRFGERLSIRVCDTGTGIADTDLPHVFDPYFTTRRTGTGLGLAIAKNVVEGLGGRITAATRPEGGAEIRLDLPLVTPDAAADDAPRSSPPDAT